MLRLRVRIPTGPLKMKTVFTSDLHGNETVYNKLFSFIKKENIKKIILGGDLTPHAHTSIDLAINIQKDFLEWLIKKIKNTDADFYVMLGNDDFRINAPLLEAADKKGILKYIHNKKNKIDDFNIIGYSFVNQMPFRLKDWEKLDNKNSKPLTSPEIEITTMPKEKGTIEEDMKKIKKLSNPEKTIYVTHAPPFNTNLDIIRNGVHVGSRSIRNFIEKEKPLLTLHGHIHESYEVSEKYLEKINKTVCINPGSSHLKSELNLIIFELENLNTIKHFIL